MHTSAAQGVFYVVTGLWPIIHYRSFEAVTGPKTDVWLVKTLGALIGVVGASLCVAGVQNRSDRALRALGIGSAVALGLSDFIYAVKGTISPVYLLDAAVEGALVARWRRTPQP
jgi:hypothetical protein